LLNGNLSVLATIHDRYPQKTIGEVRALLARFVFVEDDVLKPVSVLSGGEKVRLSLCLLMLEEPELLILDEPTNHLDLETKDIVEEVFESYEGPIIFISHDRYFINRVASKILRFDKNGPIVFEGNYDQFKEYLAARAESKTPRTAPREKSPNLGAEIRKLEAEIDRIHRQREPLQTSLFEERVYGDPEEYRKVAETIAALEAEAETLFEKMASLSGE